MKCFEQNKTIDFIKKEIQKETNPNRLRLLKKLLEAKIRSLER
tara:strand:+ start:410 stop:538 length:129 start_codon:yes stop_codon:yes gene_type:complete